MSKGQVRRVAECRHCCVERPIHARGLCTRCYQSLGGYGGAITPRTEPDEMWWLYDRKTRTAEERAEDYLWMKTQNGDTLEQAAHRMGIRKENLRVQLKRAGVMP